MSDHYGIERWGEQGMGWREDEGGRREGEGGNERRTREEAEGEEENGKEES